MSFNEKEEVMLKQVPEGSVALDVQFDRLRERLFDHQVFQRSRGEFGFLTDMLEELAEEAESATDFLRRLDRIFADARTVANLYAQFLQDGHYDAAAEVLQALEDSTHLLPREEVLSERTAPYTLLMFEPEKTIFLLKLCFNWNGSDMWKYIYSKWSPLWRASTSRIREVRENAKEVQINRAEFPKEMQELCSRLPSIIPLLSKFREYPDCFPPCLLGESYCQDVTLSFVHEANDPLRQFFHAGRRLYPAQGISRAYLFNRRFKGGYTSLFDWEIAHAELGFLETSNCAFLLKGDRSAIVSCFPRPMQDRIATWQFHIPENVHTYSCKVGLHTEAEHERWQGERPSFCSTNLYSGWGAMILHHDRHYTVRYDADEEVTRMTLEG